MPQPCQHLWPWDAVPALLGHIIILKGPLWRRGYKNTPPAMTEKEAFRRRWTTAAGDLADLERVLSTYDSMVEGLLGLGMSREEVGPWVVPPPPLRPRPWPTARWDK